VEKNKFVRMLQTFRPAQTVFETGIGTGSMGTKINGGAHPQQMSLKNKLVKGAEMMKALREATHASLERNRVAVAQQQAAAKQQGGDVAEDSDEDAEGSEDEEDEEDEDQEFGSDSDESASGSDDDDQEEDSDEDDDVDEYEMDADVSFTTALSGPARRQSAGTALREAAIDRTASAPKVRMSITEKKKLKKKGLTQTEIREVALRKLASEKALLESGMEVTDATSREKKSSGGAMSTGLSDAFRDRKHYMAYGDEDATQSFAEESMQPKSHLRSSESMSK
jgi:hypothetical protein